MRRSSVFRKSELGLSQVGGSNKKKVSSRKRDKFTAPMPAVGMRRTRRVFGVVKGGGDGARVLRSGRKLWQVESGEARYKKSNSGGDEWLKKLLDHNGGGNENGGWASNSDKRKQRVPPVLKEKEDGKHSENVVDRMFGIKYYRKRKMNVLDGKESEFSDKKYGIKFVRRKKRKIGSDGVVGFVEGKADVWGHGVFAVAVEHSCYDSSRSSSFSLLACFLNSVLRYMKRNAVRIGRLCDFLLSEPIASVYLLHGIHFLWDPPSSRSFGVCKIYGSTQSAPLFSVNFSALPLCFMYMQSSMLLRSERLILDLIIYPKIVDFDAETFDDSIELPSCILSSRDLPYVKLDDNPWKKRVVNVTSGPAKVSRRGAQSRNGFNSRSTRGKRSSLRSKRVRNPSFIGVPKVTGRTSSEFYSTRKGIPFSMAVSNQFLRRSVQNRSAENVKELKSDAVGSREDIDSASCSANILVIEADRCYREEGATIMLDLSPSNEWFLVVKKDGLRRYRFKAENVMRPCASNRVTHAIIWTVEDNWKLEFPNRADWSIFKELYKNCSQKNVLDPMVKIIPIPGICIVPGYKDEIDTVFSRPMSYITVGGDEVSRALAKRGSNYDMDSDDEEWLDKFNNEALLMNELHESISRETFELMVDVFEKAFYCNAGDYSDEKAVSDLCPDLGRREVIEAVYNYWMKKRKQKRSALVRVFQNYQPRRPSVLADTVLRKKRSFKRQPSQAGRAKQRSVLQAIAAEQDVFDEQSVMLKVEEAKASANRHMKSAIGKRRRAQVLMESANMMAYKAVKALRIAEAIQFADSPDATAASNFLDQLIN